MCGRTRMVATQDDFEPILDDDDDDDNQQQEQQNQQQNNQIPISHYFPSDNGNGGNTSAPSNDNGQSTNQASLTSIATAPAPELASAASSDQSKTKLIKESCENLSPGRYIPILLLENGKKVIKMVRWGLIPNYTKVVEGGKLDFFKMFNARDDNLVNIHKGLLSSRRCVVLVNGFYEWAKSKVLGKMAKEPYYIHGPNKFLFFAGLYDVCRINEEETITSCTIITTSMMKEMLWLHDRMPVVLTNKEQINLWIDNSRNSFSQVRHLLKPLEPGYLSLHKVTSKIGVVSYQEPDCSVSIEKSEKGKGGNLLQFFKVNKKETPQLVTEAASTNAVVQTNEIVDVDLESSSDPKPELKREREEEIVINDNSIQSIESSVDDAKPAEEIVAETSSKKRKL